MQALFLNKKLEVIDNANLSSYDIFEDLLIEQTSSFIVYKEGVLNVKTNDFLAFKINNEDFMLFVIKTIEKNGASYSISCNSSLSIFDIAIKDVAVNGKDSSLEQALANLITTTLNSSDPQLNIAFSQIDTSSNVKENLTYQVDTATSLLEKVRLASTAFNVVTKLYLTYDGSFGFHLEIKEKTESYTIRELQCYDLVIEDSVQDEVNKMIFYPKEENLTYKETYIYYATNQVNTVTEDPNDPNRLNKEVIQQVNFYDDSYDSLDLLIEDLKSQCYEVFNPSQYDHYIEFTSLKTDFNIGDKLILITKNKTYETIISQLERKTNNLTLKVKAGINRITLTDKLKLRQRRLG